MRHLKLAAQVWIAVVLAGGCLGLVLAGLQWTQLDPADPAVWVFLVGACIGHAFPAVAPRHQAYHASQSFLMAAVLLVSWPAVVLIVLAAHIIEWVRRPRPWYIQLYNAAVYVLGAGGAMATLALLHASPFEFGQPFLIVDALVAAAVVLVLNHGLTAIVLRLARGVSFAESALFGRESLGLDGTLLVVGIAMAGGWRAQPLSLLVTAAPLTLIYRALRLVNVEVGSHRDQLSGLYNRRHLLEALDLELRRASRLADPTGFIVAVLDDVPGIVQRYGRATLDFLVAGIGQRLTPCLREYDQVARLDEGTFGFLLPGVGDIQVKVIAQRVTDQVSARPFIVPTTREPVLASVSLAYSSLAPGGPPPKAADIVASMRHAVERAVLVAPRAVVEATDATRPSAAVNGVALESQPLPTTGTATAEDVAATTSTWAPSRRMLLAFEGAVICLGLIVSVAMLISAPLPDLPLAAGIVGLVTISELLAFDLYDRSSFSVSFAPILAAGLLGGVPAAVLATWSVAVARGLLRRTVWHHVLFNGSAFTITGVLATLVATAVGRLPVSASVLAPLALTTALASTAYYLHTFVITGALALDLGVDPRQVWTRNFRWLYPHYLVLGWMGLGLAVATIELGPLGTALFLAPPLAMRYVLKQYIDRTSGVVERLETTNAELRSASALLQRRSEELSLLSDLGQLAAAEPGVGTLPALVLRRCVPALGDACALVWRGAHGLECTVHALPEAQAVATGLQRLPPEEVLQFATTSNDGTWLAAPLPGADEAVGWLLGWTHTQQPVSERSKRLELMGEVARRLALVLERDQLLEEAAELDALRVVDRAKSDFIATTAHELRTPLTSLQGYAELLRNEVEPELRDRWLRILHVEAAQLGQVLDQLLDVSRLDSGRFHAERKAFDLAEVVERVIQESAAQASLSGHELQSETAGVPQVFADPTQVQRVLRNLVSNALKYSPGGGPVLVAAVERSRGEVEVCVQDHGLGIPPDWLGRLFERFQRVNLPERASIRGTGLGLYIARQLVELNGGRIWATSDGIDCGSTFHFTLPLAPQGRRRTSPSALP